MYECDYCKEEFLIDEVNFFCGHVETCLEEEGGSGDIDIILCHECYDKAIRKIKYI